MRADVPVVFLAYDLLEWEGADWRGRPLSERRQKLEIVMEAAQQCAPAVMSAARLKEETLWLFDELAPRLTGEWPLGLSAVIEPLSWEDLTALQKEARERHVEGLMLKRLSSPYGVGRTRGDWWKWKVDPLVIDAVLISAQPGHGRRASLFTDYTFGVWHEGSLVPVAKAYSGLTDEEILRVDAFVRRNTIEKFGPIRAVKPELVFELAFDSVQFSKRHKSGVAVRFPRMNRWRIDKKPSEADSLDALRALVKRDL